jgi:DNA-binding transcriptional ArsR family regulator
MNDRLEKLLNERTRLTKRLILLDRQLYAGLAAQTAKAAKSAASRKVKGKPYGHTRVRILEALGKAGVKGMKVADLARKLGMRYGTVAVWFATTGKKVRGVKKVAPATFAFQK